MAFAPRNRPRPGRKPPPDYLSSSVQRRLLLMMGSLVLVVLLMRTASRPESWGWIWSFRDRPATTPLGCRQGHHPHRRRRPVAAGPRSWPTVCSRRRCPTQP